MVETFEELDKGMESHSRFPWRWLMGALVAGLLVWGGWWQWRDSSSSRQGPEFMTVAVERGDVVSFIRATGRLNSIRKIEVGSQISGNIAEIFADFNDRVNEGDLIARLDTATYEAQVQLAGAEKESAVYALELRKLTEDRFHELMESGHTTQAELDRATAERRQAEAAVRIRESALRKARIDLERCYILSPTAGVIISRNVNVGQTVAASLSAPVLFEIADDLSRMKINTHVSEADIGPVREGQKVEFKVDAWRDETFFGKVRQVRNAPIMVDNVVTYDTVVYVDNPEGKMKPGMTAEVNLITDERRNVLRLRNAALRARLPEQRLPAKPPQPSPQHRVVYRMQPNGSLDAVWVETGISDGFYTEILAGLNESDSVVVGLELRPDGDSTGERGSLFTGRQAQY